MLRLGFALDVSRLPNSLLPVDRIRLQYDVMITFAERAYLCDLGSHDV